MFPKTTNHLTPGVTPHRCRVLCLWVSLEDMTASTSSHTTHREWPTTGMLRLESKFSKGIHHFSTGSHHFSKGNLNRISQILSHMIWLSGQFGILFSPTGWFFPEIFRDLWVPLLKPFEKRKIFLVVGWLFSYLGGWTTHLKNISQIGMLSENTKFETTT